MEVFKDWPQHSLSINQYGSSRQTITSVLKALHTNLQYEKLLSHPDLSHLTCEQLTQLTESRLSTVAWVLHARQLLKSNIRIHLSSQATFKLINFLDVNFLLDEKNIDSMLQVPSKTFIAIKVASLLVAMKNETGLEWSANRKMIQYVTCWPPRASQNSFPLFSPVVSTEEVNETEAVLMFRSTGLQSSLPENIVNLMCYYLIIWLTRKHVACCGDDAMDLVKLSNSAITKTWQILLSAYLHMGVALVPAWKCAVVASEMGVGLACGCFGWKPCLMAPLQDALTDLLLKTGTCFDDLSHVQTLFNNGCAVCKSNIPKGMIRDSLVSLTEWSCFDCCKLTTE